MLVYAPFDQDSLRQLEWRSPESGYHGHSVVVSIVGGAPCSWLVDVDDTEARGWDDSEREATRAAFAALRKLIAAADAA